jgi:hypothetical protein
MTRKLLLATAVAALVTGGALAQTINNAPQNSPAGVANEVKQAPRTGDSSQVGGTPSANTKGLQSQLNTKGLQSQLQDPQRSAPAQVPHPTAPVKR